nr:MAG TPA: hypothetical protein [Caudoviricetes sp.]
MFLGLYSFSIPLSVFVAIILIRLFQHINK